MKENAQHTTVEMADQFLNSNGKIFVVLGVLLIILFGIFGYLFSVEKKLKRLEKQNSK